MPINILNKFGLPGTLGGFAFFFAIALALQSLQLKGAAKWCLTASFVCLVASFPLVWDLLFAEPNTNEAALPQNQSTGVKIKGSEDIVFVDGRASGFQTGVDVDNSKRVDLSRSELIAPLDLGLGAASTNLQTSQIAKKAPPVVMPPGTPPEEVAARQEMADRLARGELLGSIYIAGASNLNFIGGSSSGHPRPFEIIDSTKITIRGMDLGAKQDSLPPQILKKEKGPNGP